jgi:hypothetical protein
MENSDIYSPDLKSDLQKTKTLLMNYHCLRRAVRFIEFSVVK